jgi:hypothetical protein
VVAPSGAPHAAQFDEKDEWDDRPGLTSQEKIEYKALEARVWALVQQEKLDHPHAEMSDEACRMFDKMDMIVSEGERRYQKENLGAPEKYASGEPRWLVLGVHQAHERGKEIRLHRESYLKLLVSIWEEIKTMRRQIADLDPEDSDPDIEIRPEWLREAAFLEAQVRSMDYTGSKRGLWRQNQQQVVMDEVDLLPECFRKRLKKDAPTATSSTGPGAPSGAPPPHDPTSTSSTGPGAPSGAPPSQPQDPTTASSSIGEDKTMATGYEETAGDIIRSLLSQHGEPSSIRWTFGDYSECYIKWRADRGDDPPGMWTAQINAALRKEEPSKISTFFDDEGLVAKLWFSADAAFQNIAMGRGQDTTATSSTGPGAPSGAPPSQPQDPPAASSSIGEDDVKYIVRVGFQDKTYVFIKSTVPFDVAEIRQRLQNRLFSLQPHP